MDDDTRLFHRRPWEAVVGRIAGYIIPGLDSVELYRTLVARLSPHLIIGWP
jgi:hypothetical protein